MSLLSHIADRLILAPTTRPVDAKENRREIVSNFDGVEIEAYVSQVGEFESGADPKRKLIALKFAGAGGRAERSTAHPCESMIKPNCADSPFTGAEIWTLNHRGYGQSTGPASIQNFVSTIELFWTHLDRRYPEMTKITTGNSLGCVSALYLAARKNVAAMMLRNPPPLSYMISNRPRYNVWNFGLARYIAAQVPDVLDAIANAGDVECPVLVISSEKDRVVPTRYQRHIVEGCLGNCEQFVIPEADHHHRVPDSMQKAYQEAIGRLCGQIEFE